MPLTVPTRLSQADISFPEPAIQVHFRFLSYIRAMKDVAAAFSNHL